MTIGASVIVSTYQRPDALAAVLRGLIAQADRDFEVVVADDGSDERTEAVVARFAAASHGPRTVHVRQEDEGFRLARIRNLAAIRAEGSRLIFLDGDCVPRPGFVGSHRGCRPGRATCGRRALLAESATDDWLAAAATSSCATPGPLAQLGLWRRGGLNRPPFLADPVSGCLGVALSWRRFRGMNHAVHRDDYVAVDGNDQSFTGWGFEDSDLGIRLLNHGVRLVAPGRGSTVFHLWHREADRSLEGVNRIRLDEVRASGRVRAVEGISSLR